MCMTLKGRISFEGVLGEVRLHRDGTFELLTEERETAEPNGLGPATVYFSTRFSVGQDGETVADTDFVGRQYDAEALV